MRPESTTNGAVNSYSISTLSLAAGTNRPASRIISGEITEYPAGAPSSRHRPSTMSPWVTAGACGANHTRPTASSRTPSSAAARPTSSM